jgi:hypothetical protein
MDAIDMLKADPKKVKQLFRQYEAAGDRAYQKKGIAEEGCTEITIHRTLEEEIFYPAVKAETDKEGKELGSSSLLVTWCGG